MVDLFRHWYLFWFSFLTLVWFSSARTVVWLSFLVSAILILFSMRFSYFWARGFLQFSKNLNLNSKFGRHSFLTFVHICSYFRCTSCIYVITFVKITFSRDSRQRYRFMHWCDSTLYSIHFEFARGPCNLIGSNWCDLFTNRTIFCSKSHYFTLDCVFHICRQSLSVLYTK